MCSHESRKKCGSTWVSQSHSSSEGFSDKATLRYIFHIHSKHRYAAKSQLDSRCLYIHECKSPWYGEAKVDWRKLFFLNVQKVPDTAPFRWISTELSRPWSWSLLCHRDLSCKRWSRRPGEKDEKRQLIGWVTTCFFWMTKQGNNSYRTPQEAGRQKLSSGRVFAFWWSSHWTLHRKICRNFLQITRGPWETKTENAHDEKTATRFGNATTPGAQWSWTLWGPRAADVHLAAWSEWRSGGHRQQVGGCWVDPGDDIELFLGKINKTRVNKWYFLKSSSYWQLRCLSW